MRGADPDSPASNGIKYCESLTLGAGQVQASDCTEANVTCIKCSGDNAESAGTSPGATGATFTLGDNVSCGGQKQTGECGQDPVSLNWVCAGLAWDNQTYCSGEIQQAVFQIHITP